MAATPASLSWTDAQGSATLTSAWPGPSARFHNWQPGAPIEADKAPALADGRRYAFVFRADYTATFELRGIAPADVEKCLRLQAHLDGGGTVSVTTGDAEGHVYATCCQAPETDPTGPELDTERYEYSMKFALLNVAATPVPMVCRYFGAPES